jgi:hypothetical protein
VLYPFTGNFLLLIEFNIGADASKPDWKTIKNFLLREGKVGKDMTVKLIK